MVFYFYYIYFLFLFCLVFFFTVRDVKSRKLSRQEDPLVELDISHHNISYKTYIICTYTTFPHLTGRKKVVVTTFVMN